MPTHKTDCPCSFCAKLKARVMTEGAWRLVHDTHLINGDQHTTKPLEDAPEGYPAFWLCCPCGSQILTMKPSDDIR